MSKCIKCDVCGRTNPDVDITFSKKRVTSWFKRWVSFYGNVNYYEKLDVCDDCWDNYKDFCKSKLWD